MFTWLFLVNQIFKSEVASTSRWRLLHLLHQPPLYLRVVHDFVHVVLRAGNQLLLTKVHGRSDSFLGLLVQKGLLLLTALVLHLAGVEGRSG